MPDQTYFCPKCFCRRITVEVLDTKPDPEPISMNAMPQHHRTISAVYKSTNYRATCDDCGYMVEW